MPFGCARKGILKAVFTGRRGFSDGGVLTKGNRPPLTCLFKNAQGSEKICTLIFRTPQTKNRAKNLLFGTNMGTGDGHNAGDVHFGHLLVILVIFWEMSYPRSTWPRHSTQGRFWWPWYLCDQKTQLGAGFARASCRTN